MREHVAAQRVLAWMRENPGTYGRGAIKEALDLSEGDWRSAVDHLVSADAVERLGRGRATRYRARLPGPRDGGWAFRSSGVAPSPGPSGNADDDRARPGDLLAALPELARRIAERAGQERDARVFARYHGFDGEAPTTLQAIGDSLDLTRERVRQIKERLCERLVAAFDGASPVEGHPPAEWIPREARALRRLVGTNPVPQPEERLAAVVRQRCGRELSDTDRLALPVLLELLGGRPVHSRGLGLPAGDRYWSFGEGFDPPLVARVIHAVRELLRDRPEGAPLERVAAEVDRQVRASLGDAALLEILSCMDEVEVADGERVRVRFGELVSHADRALRILFEEGRPLHFREIAHRINARCRDAGLEPIVFDPRGVSARMSRSDRFVPIGRTGWWRLAEWPSTEVDVPSTTVPSPPRPAGASRARLEELVREYLHGRPDRTSPIGDVRKAVRARAGAEDHAIYRTVSGMDDVRKETRGGVRVAILVEPD